MGRSIDDAVRAWLAAHHQVVLVTLRADGSAQTSNISALFDTVGGDRFRASVTTDRAKTRNLERDPRAVAHVLGDDFWAYGSLPCTAGLGPVTTEPGDAAGRELLEVYNGIAPQPHPDPDDFFTTMVAEKRLVLTLRPDAISGFGW